MTFKEYATSVLADTTETDRRVALELATRVADDGTDAIYTAIDFLQFLRGQVPADLTSCPACGFPDRGDAEDEAEPTKARMN